MNRVLAFIAVIFLIALPLVGESNSFLDPLPGEFVFYRDYSWKAPTWTGFLRYDDSTYAGMLITPSTGTNVSILFRGETSSGAFVLTGQKIISKITNDDVPAVNYLMKLIADMHSWKAVANTKGIPLDNPERSSLLPSQVSTTCEASMFGGEVQLIHAAEIPVFALLSLYSPDGKPQMVLERSGMIQDGKDADFFAFNPRAGAKESKTFTLKANSAAKEILGEDVRFSLDDQWIAVAENIFFLDDTAMLVVDTLDVVSIGIPEDNLPVFLVRYFSSSTRYIWASPEKTRVSGSGKRFRIDNVFYDAESGFRNYDIKLCIPESNKKSVCIVSMTVGETAYQENRAYFDAILSSVKK